MSGANLYFTDGRLIGRLNGRDRICGENGSALFTVSRQILTSLRTGIRYTILADGRVIDPKGVQVAYYQAQPAQQAAPRQQAKAAPQVPAKRPAEKPSAMALFLYTVASVIVIVYLLPPLTAQFIGLCAAVAVWHLYKRGLKTAARQYDADRVDWNGVGRRLLDLSRILPQISFLPLMAEGDCALAELYGDAFSWHKNADSWVLSAALHVDDEAYARRHGKDSAAGSSGDCVSIRYSYPEPLAGLLEQIDHNCSVSLYAGGSGSLDFYLGIPAGISASVIRDRLLAVSPSLSGVTSSLPRRDRDVFTIR